MEKIVKFLPSSITLSRILMTFIFGYSAYLHGHNIFLLTLFFTICLSDLSDGKLARKFNVTSALGAKLDVFADLLFMLVSYSVFMDLRIIPAWFLLFVFAKFMEFTITSKIINSYESSAQNPFVFDKAGRIVAVLFYIIPGAACIFGSKAYLIDLILYMTLAGGAYSSYSRIKRCFELARLRIARVSR